MNSQDILRSKVDKQVVAKKDDEVAVKKEIKEESEGVVFVEDKACVLVINGTITY